MPDLLAPDYPLTRADQIYLTNRVRHWIDQLGLADWTYQSIEFCPKEGMADLARCHVFADPHAFRLQVRTVWDIPVCPQNIDNILVHELLHVVLGDLWQFAFELCAPGINELLNRAEHQAIARLTRAIAPQTMVLRGLEGVEEIPENSPAIGATAELACGSGTAQQGLVPGRGNAATGRVQAQGAGSLSDDADRWLAAARVGEDDGKREAGPVGMIRQSALCGITFDRWFPPHAEELRGYTLLGAASIAFAAGWNARDD